MCTKTEYIKKSYLRLHSGDRNSGTATNPTFILNGQIENISGFQIKQFIMNPSDVTSKIIKVNSAELSSLTSDKLLGTYQGASQTILDLNLASNIGNVLEDSPIYQCQNGRVGIISLDFKDEAGSAVTAGLTDSDLWTLVICFYQK
jgi:hypothetical protein